MQYRCPIAGHDHEVTLVRNLVQDGTGQKAALFECPTGRYRWFVLEGQQLSDRLRMKRSRFGWRPDNHLDQGGTNG